MLGEIVNDKKQSDEPAKFIIHKRLNLLHPADDVTLEELEGEWDPKYVAPSFSLTANDMFSSELSWVSCGFISPKFLELAQAI